MSTEHWTGQGWGLWLRTPSWRSQGNLEEVSNGRIIFGQIITPRETGPKKGDNFVRRARGLLGGTSKDSDMLGMVAQAWNLTLGSVPLPHPLLLSIHLLPPPSSPSLPPAPISLVFCTHTNQFRRCKMESYFNLLIDFRGHNPCLKMPRTAVIYTRTTVTGLGLTEKAE